MAIPKQDSIGLPLLELLGDTKTHTLKECVDVLAKHFELTEEEVSERVQSGARRFHNRVAWTRMRLKSVGFLESPERGTLRITSAGQQVLIQKPPKLGREFLLQYEGYKNLISQNVANASENGTSDTQGSMSEDTPAETMARSRAEKPWMGREISAVKPGRTESGTTAVRAGQRRKWP